MEVENPDVLALPMDTHPEAQTRGATSTVRVLGTCGTCLYGWNGADMQLTRCIAEKEWASIAAKVFPLLGSPSSPSTSSPGQWAKSVDDVFARLEGIFNSSTGDSDRSRGGGGNSGVHRKVYLSSRRYVSERGHTVWAELAALTATHLATSLHSDGHSMEAAIEMAHCLKTIRLAIRARLLQIYYIVFIEHEPLLSAENQSLPSSPCQDLPEERHSESSLAGSRPTRLRTVSAGVVGGGSQDDTAAVEKTTPPLSRKSRDTAVSQSGNGKRRSSWTVGVATLASMLDVAKPSKPRLSGSTHTQTGASDADRERKQHEEEAKAAAAAELASLHLLDDEDDDEYVLTLDRLYLGIAGAGGGRDGHGGRNGVRVLPLGLQDIVNRCIKVRTSLRSIRSHTFNFTHMSEDK